MAQDPVRRARVLANLQQKAVCEGPFQATRETQAFHKCDLDRCFSDDSFTQDVGEMLMELFDFLGYLQPFSTLWLGGKSNGVWHLVRAASVAAAKRSDGLIVHAMILEKDGSICGSVPPGERVVLVEDILSTGCSTLEAVTMLRQHGAVVEDAAIFICRNQAGARRLKEAGLHVNSLFNLRGILPARLHADIPELP